MVLIGGGLGASAGHGLDGTPEMGKALCVKRQGALVSMCASPYKAIRAQSQALQQPNPIQPLLAGPISKTP